MKKICIALLPLLAPVLLKAQLLAFFYVEGGLLANKYETKELPVFLQSYNAYYPTLSTQFRLDPGLSRGWFFNVACGIGDEKVKMVLSLGPSLGRTSPFEARFPNGYGRDIWAEYKCFNSIVGVRFGDKFYVQPEFNILFQRVNIYSARVFPDGSTSFGRENVLNGIYTALTPSVSAGGSLGFRVLKYFYVTGRVDYAFQLGKKHPEYNRYSDLTLIKSEPSAQQDYLPRDIAEYYNNPYNSTDNGISNDFHGLRFSVGLQFMLSNNVD